MSDRRAWLGEWCPYCWAAPGARCRQDRYSPRKRPSPTQILHVARSWRERRCPTCKALAGDPCHTRCGRGSTQPHTARLRPGRRELAAREAVWEELSAAARRSRSSVLGSRRRRGKSGTITLSRLAGDELVDVERWSGRDELALALEGPVWDRYGRFVGHPWIRGTVTWTAADRGHPACRSARRRTVRGGARMSPRAGPRVGAYGDLGAGTERARRPGRGTSPGRGLRSGRCACAGGSEVVSRCRGPPHSVPWKRERPGSWPGLSTAHRRLPAPHKISTGSVAGGRMEPRPGSWCCSHASR